MKIFKRRLYWQNKIKQTQLLLTYDLLSPVACVWLCSNSHVLKNQIKLQEVAM